MAFRRYGLAMSDTYSEENVICNILFLKVLHDNQNQCNSKLERYVTFDACLINSLVISNML